MGIEDKLRAILATRQKEARQHAGNKAWARFRLTFSIEPEDVSVGNWGIIISAQGILFRQRPLWYRLVGRCQRCGKLISIGLPFGTPRGMLNVLGNWDGKAICSSCRLALRFEWMKKRDRPTWRNFKDLVSDGEKYLPPCPMFNEWWREMLKWFPKTNPKDLE